MSLCSRFFEEFQVFSPVHCCFSRHPFLANILLSFTSLSSLSGTMSVSSECCPFCSQSFKSLGHHLPRCKARNGQDYSSILRSSSNNQFCPSCKKEFKRLDLHLRTSGLCMLPSSQGSVDQSVSDNALQLQTHSESSAPAKHNPPLPTRSATIRDPLQLPDIKDSTCWSEVNASLTQELSSHLLSMEDPDELHDSLVSKLYSVLHREFGSRSLSHHHKKKRHDRQFRRFRLLKNDARRAFRSAKRNNEPASVISALSHTFHSLIKQHSRARKASLKAHKQQDATAAIKRDFWRYTNQLLQESSESIKPRFTSTKAFDYFQGVYAAKRKEDFHQPSWLPNVPLRCAPPNQPAQPVTIDEVRNCIRRSRAKSAPSPLDQISYLLLKMCPSLLPILVHLYNIVLHQRIIPQGWK